MGQCVFEGPADLIFRAFEGALYHGGAAASAGAAGLVEAGVQDTGVFFISCFVMPMTGMFTGMAESKGNGGSLALLFWCAYFFPIGVLAWKHFNSEKI